MQVQLLLERACAWIALWRADQAYADLHEVLLLDPRCVRAYCVLGQLLVQGGKLTGARDAFRRALALDATTEEARVGLAAVESRLVAVSQGQDRAARRPATLPGTARPHGRRSLTSPTGHSVATLTTLIRRSPDRPATSATSGMVHRRSSAAISPTTSATTSATTSVDLALQRSPDAAPVSARSREKTAPYRAPLGAPHARTSSAPRATTSAGHGSPRAATAPLPRAATAPALRATTAPLARATTSPVPRATTSPMVDRSGPVASPGKPHRAE